MSSHFNELVADLSAAGINASSNVSMARYTTYGVGGNAACMAFVSASQLNTLATTLSRYPDIPVLVVGRGSNLLVSDEGFGGLAISLAEEADALNIDFKESEVSVSAALPMPVLARRTAAAGRTGLEWCVGIPGSVGGAVRMNAGGHGADMTDSLVSATVLSLRSGKTVEVAAAHLGLHFRGSALAMHHIVVRVTLRTRTIAPEDAVKVLDDIVAWRRDNQPGGRNAGSVFVNPAPNDGSAGALIDAAGLRGFVVGGAQVSEKHANFIQAKPGATAKDIIDVMTHVQSQVELSHGVRMRSEVALVGFGNEVQMRFADPRHTEVDRVEAARRLAASVGDAQ
jgi:UDP-N-acetylmuramate dehydrogenase